MNKVSEIGFGAQIPKVAVYVAKRPSMQEYAQLEEVQPLVEGEIKAIGQACGNGWRKVFNVYAKLLFALDEKHFDYGKQAKTWQEYRDQFLLQKHSDTALLFSPPRLNKCSSTIHIISGRTHAIDMKKRGELNIELDWLDKEFAINRPNRLFVCPYFDYRQLSNIKIERLSCLISDQLK